MVIEIDRARDGTKEKKKKKISLTEQFGLMVRKHLPSSRSKKKDRLTMNERAVRRSRHLHAESGTKNTN